MSARPCASPRRRRAPARRARGPRRHGPLGRQLHRRQVGRRRPAAGRLHVPALRPRVGRPCSSCCAGARGARAAARETCIAIAGSGRSGSASYQILWTTGLTTIAAGDSALIIAATPVLVALLAVVARSDVLTPVKLAGVLVSFVGVALVIASGPGLSLGGSLVGEALTLRRGHLLGDLHGLRRAVPAPLLAAPGDRLGDGRRHDRPRADRHRPAARPSTPPTLDARPSSAPSLYSGLSRGRDLERHRDATGSRSSGRPGPRRYQFLVPALAVVLAFVFLPSRSGPARSSAAW